MQIQPVIEGIILGLALAIMIGPAMFALYHPANSSTVTTDSLTFSWASTSDVDPNDKISFTIEYSTNSNFSENVITVPK